MGIWYPYRLRKSISFFFYIIISGFLNLFVVSIIIFWKYTSCSEIKWRDGILKGICSIISKLFSFKGIELKFKKNFNSYTQLHFIKPKLWYNKINWNTIPPCEKPITPSKLVPNYYIFFLICYKIITASSWVLVLSLLIHAYS